MMNQFEKLSIKLAEVRMLLFSEENQFSAAMIGNNQEEATKTRQQCLDRYEAILDLVGEQSVEIRCALPGGSDHDI